ncbi:MAG: hypothetical protein NTX32_04945 [Candidatus Firestonebacteria bacterium]|nr:hypothetical protein [Candidatus Firestonebacteria bacterium]
MRTKNVLSDDFWFKFIKHMWFTSFQFTRFIGSSWRADNHHLMERGTAFYYLGVGFPEFKHERKLEVYARKMILRHFDHKLLKDNTGVSFVRLNGKRVSVPKTHLKWYKKPVSQ